ncbi:hypothetical protein [Rhabdochromatium marinum]|uniref:hypothetical protein n=1 Tax=Rhabdochromatium marinum TaxID=48729 RepID=UPI001904EC06|nr:hypothetical protein [Rhabdochromatium marinum]MBK1647722.1 hypothetical protein [Rhabdochromatium marinum]
MPEPTFDVQFSGELIGAATLEHVKQRVAEAFKLDQAGIDRLFCGQAVFIKRGVDHPTAERYREAFRKLGAVADIIPVGGESEEVFRFDDSDEETAASSAQPAAATRAQAATSNANAALSIAPAGATLEELSDQGPEQNPDTSKLSLVEGQDWSLEDCAPPPLAEPIPDIDSMEMEPQSMMTDSSRDS